MWLFSQKGFFSIVEHKDNSDLLLVRSRIKGDIERCWPTAAVRENEGSDYRFRASIPRTEVINKVAKIVKEINYPDFKASLVDTKRIRWYSRVWEIMATMQDYFQSNE